MYKLILYWNTIRIIFEEFYIDCFNFLSFVLSFKKNSLFFFFAYLVIPYILVSVKIISITTRFPAGKRVFYGYNGDI